MFGYPIHVRLIARGRFKNTECVISLCPRYTWEDFTISQLRPAGSDPQGMHS